jgi:hypothetical protein
MDIIEERRLFCNDLYEYKASEQGQEVERYIYSNSPDTDRLQEALTEYYKARHYKKFTYKDKGALQAAKELDKYVCDMYKELN